MFLQLIVLMILMHLKLPQTNFHNCPLDQGSTAIVLTRNNRQSVFLEHQWSQHFPAKALSDPPLIIPIHAWLNHFWIEHDNSFTILKPTDALCLLTEIIEKDEDCGNFDTMVLATHILNGYVLMIQWQLSLDDLTPYAQDQNTELFLKYTIPFQKQLEQKSLILAQSIPSLLTQRLSHDQTLVKLLPTSFFLYGFVDINPSLENLFETLSHYRPTQLVEITQIPNRAKAIVYHKRTDELNAMAKWAIEEHHAHPEKKIICVVPDLTHTHANCLEAFLKADPQSLSLINISSGEALNQTLVGQSALNFLNLRTYRTPLKSLAQCIQNELWLDNTLPMQIEKDRLATQLYTSKKPILSLKQWIDHLTTDHALADELLNHLKQWLLVKLNRPKGKQTYQTWMHYFFEELNALHWPGKQALFSLHYQQYQHLQQVWISFLELDNLLEPCHYDQALQTLNLLCKQNLFAPESKQRPIHVLGALEAHGLECDTLWMCHCDGNTWPPHSKPNPLLPFRFQKEKKMPNACHIYTQKYYETITQDIVHSSENVILSYTQWHDNLKQSPSPIFHNVGFQQINTIEPNDQNNDHFQKIDDLFGTALLENKLPGGSYGLQSQAQCPFQYYARFRLNLSDSIEPSIGFDPMERGNLVHESLAYFYQDIRDSKDLRSLSENHRNQRIHNAIETCLIPIDKNKLFIETEKKRLNLLLNQWIDFELQRPDFKIQSIEWSTQLTIHDFIFTVRMDRIDCLDDHSLLVIDYKSGQQANSSGWQDDRLTNPQMPLYVLALGSECESAALALVKRGESKLVGISKNSTDIKGIRSTHKDEETKQWTAMKNQWQSKISNLIFEIKDGYAAVMPDKSSNPCEHCDMVLLCRVHHD